jgi:hypothetical protein
MFVQLNYGAPTPTADFTDRHANSARYSIHRSLAFGGRTPGIRLDPRSQECATAMRWPNPVPYLARLGPDAQASTLPLAGLVASARPDSWDAAVVTGGLPLICAEWPRGAGLWDFLREALADPVSALPVSAERSLAAEFPPQAQARAVLSAIGSGKRAGGPGAGSGRHKKRAARR